MTYEEYGEYLENRRPGESFASYLERKPELSRQELLAVRAAIEAYQGTWDGPGEIFDFATGTIIRVAGRVPRSADVLAALDLAGDVQVALWSSGPEGTARRAAQDELAAAARDPLPLPDDSTRFQPATPGQWAELHRRHGAAWSDELTQILDAASTGERELAPSEIVRIGAAMVPLHESTVLNLDLDRLGLTAEFLATALGREIELPDLPPAFLTGPETPGGLTGRLRVPAGTPAAAPDTNRMLLRPGTRALVERIELESTAGENGEPRPDSPRRIAVTLRVTDEPATDRSQPPPGHDPDRPDGENPGPDGSTPEPGPPDNGGPTGGAGHPAADPTPAPGHADPSEDGGARPEEGRDPGPTGTAGPEPRLAGPAPDGPGPSPGSRDATDAAVQTAVASRSPNGDVDPAALARFVESVPSLDVSGPDGVVGAVGGFTADVLSRDDVVLAPIVGGRGKGRSGAPVFLASDGSGEVIAVSKIFPKLDVLLRELSALDRLGADEFTRFTVPEPLGVALVDRPDGKAGVLVTSVAAGRSLFDMINEVPPGGSPGRAPAMAELRQALADVAAALAELHTRPGGSGGPADRSFLDRNLGKARRETAAVVAHRDVLRGMGLDVDELSRRVDEAIEAALTEPGNTALTHGDASPANIFWDRGRGVTFIDVSNSHLGMDDAGAPIGSPAWDVSNMMQRLASFAREAGLDDQEAADLQSTFLDAYRAAGEPTLTDAALTAFRTRYTMHDLAVMLAELTKADRSVDLDGTLRERLQDEIKLLKQALGWDG
jgi:aminoglycoside phosphotransferase